MRNTRLGVPQAVRTVATQDRFDLVTRLTLILMLLSPGISGVTWPFKVPLSVAAIVGLSCPPLHRQAGLWWVITAIVGWKTTTFWWTQDNHVFLYTYWCLAIAWSLSLKEANDLLATNARWLIGGCFACAALWKGVLSADFWDGTFFYYTLLTDSRFYELGRWLVGMNPAMAQYNETVLHELVTSATLNVQVQLQGTESLWVLAKGITWWTLGIESAIAAVFVCPLVCRRVPYRHALLLLFAFTTYLVATVETFGQLLMILGLAQCESTQRYTRCGYLAAFGLMIVYDQIPLLSFLPALW